MGTAPPLPELDFEPHDGGGPPPLGARGVRPAGLPDLLLAEAVVGASAHGLRARIADRRGRARHAPLPRELRDARQAGRALRPSTSLQPEILTVAEQHKREGPNLRDQDLDRRCHVRKVEPLVKALEPYNAWISGIRLGPVAELHGHRTSSNGRAATTSRKIHPLAEQYVV